MLDVLDKSKKILEEYALCDRCLGRQFSNLATGTTNKERGTSIKLVLAMNSTLEKEQINIELLQNLSKTGAIFAKKTLKKIDCIPKETQKCYLCEGKLDELEDLVQKIVKAINEYEFESFLIGNVLDNSLYIKENKIKDKFGLHGTEYLKQEFNREIGKKISEITKKKTDFNTPEIIIECNPFSSKILEIKIRSVYIYGRYNKYVRTIPQTHWDCRNCKGKGCEKCNFTGKNYAESVEELMAKPALELTKGEKAVLHGSGREDIDVRMLGSGRPFVLEVKKPKIRNIDLKKLEEQINKEANNKIKVNNLRISSKKEVIKLKTKSQQSTKIYKAIVEFENLVSDETIKKIEENLKDKTLNQKTPTRVKHRRADIIRKKRVYEVRCKRIDEKHVEAIITCEGGTYVKELISGDEGRTEPSFTEIAENKAECVELDVLEIKEQ
ncbi:MAG: tRNA pseudouridine(54/55) synthase Pus10 [Candidatus Heimdallarchaeaceae archaeon]